MSYFFLSSLIRALISFSLLSPIPDHLQLEEVLTFSWAYGIAMLTVFQALRKSEGEEAHVESIPIIVLNSSKKVLEFSGDESLYLDDGKNGKR